MTLDQEHLPRRAFQRIKTFIVEYRETELRTQTPPQQTGNRAHLAAIHRALYQDIYQDAGQPNPETLDRANTYMEHVEKLSRTIHDEVTRTRNTSWGQPLPAANTHRITAMLAECYASIINAAPFKDGNQRVAGLFVEHIAQRSGLTLDLDRIPPRDLHRAARQSRQPFDQPGAVTTTLIDHFQNATQTGSRYDPELETKAAQLGIQRGQTTPGHELRAKAEQQRGTSLIEQIQARVKNLPPQQNTHQRHNHERSQPQR